MALRLGDIAPDFEQESSEGRIRFHDWLGEGWGVLFSHPADYTPVCTTELGLTAKLKEEFAKRNVKVLAVSVDPDTALAGSYDFMHLFGHVCLGLMWGRMARASLDALQAGGAHPARPPAGERACLSCWSRPAGGGCAARLPPRFPGPSKPRRSVSIPCSIHCPQIPIRRP